MGTLPQTDTELFQNSVKFLYNVSNLPTLNVPALKSLYSTKGRLMELRQSVFLPANLTRTSVRCQRCFLNLVEGPAGYRIKAEQKNSKFARKVLAKSHSDKPMTKYQREYLKKLSNFKGNQLAITCKFCKKESLIKLEKPKKVVTIDVTPVLSQKKKKTKKKDRFCGLNEDAVLAITPQNVRNLDNSNFIKKKSKFKLSKKENQERKSKKIKVSNDIRKSKNKLKKKNKLSEFLNNSIKSNTSSPSLKQFLQGL